MKTSYQSISGVGNLIFARTICIAYDERDDNVSGS
jgi:hypothetical protein